MTRNKQNVPIFRVTTRGLDPYIIPEFIHNLAKSVVVYPHMNLVRAGSKLHYLGWSGPELDYHAYQLALDDLADEIDLDDHELSDHIFQPYFHNA
jgi:hypothetical protein